MARKPLKTKPKPGGKKAAKATKKKPGRTAEYKAGDLVEFKGYAEEPDEGALFEEGDILLIVGVKKADGETFLDAIKAEDKEAYESDPDSVDGEEVSPSEVKRSKQKAAKEVPAEPPLKDVGNLPAILKENKGDLLKTAVGLLEDISKNYFYFGGVLAHIRRDKLFVTKYKYTDDKQGFEDFCQNELGMKAGKARAWEDVYVTFSNLPKFSEKMLAGVGWSKAAEISRYVTEDNLDELVEKAKDTPIIELKETLREDYVTEGKTPSGRTTRGASTIKRISFDFKLFEDQAEGVRMILEAAQKQLGKDANETFEHIINEWASDHLSENKAKAAKRAVRSKQRELSKSGVKVPERAAA